VNWLLSYPERHIAAFTAGAAWCVLLGVLATRHQAASRGYFDTMMHDRVDRAGQARRFRRYDAGTRLFSAVLAAVAIGLTWFSLQ
jgi:hypothetical protein